MKDTKTKRMWTSGGLALLLTGAAWAGGVEMPTCGHGFYTSLLAGSNWVSSGSNFTTVNFGGIATNAYQNNQTNNASLYGGFDIGYGWWWDRIWTTLGLETSVTSTVNSQGIVRPLYFVSTTFDALSYSYSLLTVPLFAIGQLGFNPLFERFHRMGVYIVYGLGYSWNRALEYREVPVNPVGAAAPMRSMFGDNTSGHFAYTVGAGLDFRLAPSASVALEYRYSDYGNANFNPTIFNSQGLSLSRVTANAALLRFNIWWS